MVKKVANRSIAGVAAGLPDYEVEGYGAMSYTPRGYWPGYLPSRIKQIFSDLISRQRFVPTIYSYGTPIAFYDEMHGVWIQPAVSYSVTTSHHQSNLWSLDTISIPADCGREEYHAYASRRSVYNRYGNRTYGTIQAA